jgi:energy-coupling factor transporter ATP-binding protein EcfA2
MFDKDSEKHLLRQLSNNQVVLFLGAGFSRGAKNMLGEDFPTGWGLGEKMWHFLSYNGNYDSTPLAQMYQRFLTAGIKKNEKSTFLETNLLSGDIPDFYDAYAIPHWFKIYTINIDDILSRTFRKSGRPVDELRYPIDQYSERDQSLETTQVVYLHGQLPCEPDEVIFSTQQYAKAQLSHQPLYGQFVYDYATLPTVFIGTELDEPLFEKYIEAREGKYGFRELRPKSYLITPNLSPVKADNLRDNYNVHHISGTAEDFANWIKSVKSELPVRNDILKRTFPNLLSVVQYADLAGVSRKTILQFAKAFNRVPKEFTVENDRSGFLSGTSPRWNDIVRELDIPRSITSDVYTCLESVLDADSKSDKVHLLSIIGYAGSGKSTLLKRLGIMLSQSGRTVFLSYSDFIPKVHEIIDVLNVIDEQVVFLFDNAENAMSQLPSLIDSFNKELKNPPILVLGIRTNFSNRIDHFISPDTIIRKDFRIPDLNDTEIHHLIEKLDEHNLLGILKGKSEHQRFKEFKYRANRQILIAMKEATNGKSFGDIISDEFYGIQPAEAQILCLCIALNTELGFTNSKQDLVGFSKASHIEALNYFETVLQGTIMWVGNGSRFMLRHRILADFMIRHCADPEMLKESYIRVLSILAPELKKDHGPSKKFNLFKSLINHQTLYRRFKGDIDQARDVYDSITDYFNDDAHFWLQYGSLEVEGKGGNLNLAENYLTQAESLAPGSQYVQNAKCNLLYRQARSADNLSEAIFYREQADQLAQGLLLSVGREDSYIFHIYCGGRYRFVSRWVVDREEKKRELDELKSSIRTALTFHPFNDKLKIVSDAINRAYLQLGLNDELEDPELPNYIDN